MTSPQQNGTFILAKQALKYSTDNNITARVSNLVAQIQQILAPVRPSPQFRTRLKEELLLKAYQNQKKAQTEASATSSRDWLIFTAVIGFIVSVAGFFVAKRWSNEQIIITPS